MIEHFQEIWVLTDINFHCNEIKVNEQLETYVFVFHDYSYQESPQLYFLYNYSTHSTLITTGTEWSYNQI